METMTMEGKQEERAGYKKYEVDIRRSHLKVGAPITPETVIGWHHKTSQPVLAGLHGKIATSYFNPMHNSLMIMAVSGNG